MTTNLERIDNIYNIIYEIVRCIPAGRVTSYGAIANAIGMPSGARMVGYAMNKSHMVQPPVPAHRVVNRNGLLTGKAHFETLTKMQELLNNEGVNVIDEKIKDFDKLFWNPIKESGVSLIFSV